MDIKTTALHSVPKGISAIKLSSNRKIKVAEVIF